MGILTYYLSPLYKLLTLSFMAPMALTFVSYSTSFAVRAFSADRHCLGSCLWILSSPFFSVLCLYDVCM
ncbi:uncharacterized protein BO66DRAFT_130794 [Aspergillus aculeatinus CBS 121060]|uniref:Uncharacterized protein n=1 Tax=Aspergillus aculeatinus CBS 121060 TaxID=1448322 RepID=A0ACD1H356_9EURO|nr:hypothetical protein BO66DRAFT_130794 [Aspergillus aculeatinus CBS 121060]RAH68207.1 hypothetical protein BO66DRAFT_130794 [Aspergillus aculeatinus CBS 121060]